MKPRYLCFPALLLVLFAGAFGCASGQVKKSFNDRAGEISAKITEAEQLGARNCAPMELARVKVELENVRYEAMDSRYPAERIQAEFDKAEKAATELLEKQRKSAILGTNLRCFNSGG